MLKGILEQEYKKSVGRKQILKTKVKEENARVNKGY